MGGNLAATAIQNITSKLVDGGRAVFDYSSRLEQTKVAFASMMKNADAATKHIDELLKLSRSTPLEFNSLAKMSLRLQGAGIAAKTIIPLIQDIGNVAAATGDLSAERLEGIGTALSQIASKGRVSAEEMEQLAERGIPAWRILSTSIGKTAAETRKMVEDGLIQAPQLFEAFQKFSRLNFGDAMEKQADTFSGAMKQIENNARQSAAVLFKPIYDEVAKFTSKIAKSLKEQETQAKTAGVSFGFALGEAIGDGVQRSKIGDASFFSNLVGSVYDLGVNIGQGARKGYIDSSAQGGPPTANLIPGYSPIPDLTNWGAGQQGPDAKAAAEAKKAADKRAKEREAEFQRQRDQQSRFYDLERAGERTAFSLNQKQWEEAFLAGEATKEEFREQSITSIAAYRDRVLAILEGKYKVESAGKSGLEADNLYKEYEQAYDSTVNEADQELQDVHKTIAERENKARDERINNAQQEAEDLIAITRAKAETQLANLDRDLQVGLLKETQYAQAVGAIHLATLESERAIEKDKTRQAVLDEAIKTQKIRNSMMVIKAIKDEADAQKKLTQELKEQAAAAWFKSLEDSARRSADAVAELNARLDEMAAIRAPLTDAFTELGDMFTGAFQQMAQGIGSMVESYVLLGTVGPDAMRKLTAQVLASLAAQAAAKAVFYLAEGIAALFTAPHLATNYFLASALMASIAVGAALAGRAVAGNSFKNESAGSSSGSNRSSSSNSESLTPYSRVSSTAYYSGQNREIAHLANEVARLHQKLGSMRPEDVLTTAAKRKPGFFGNQVATDIAGNAAVGVKIARNIGIR